MTDPINLSRLYNFPLYFEDLNPKPWFGKCYNGIKVPGRFKRVSSPGAFVLHKQLDFIKHKVYTPNRLIKRSRKELTRMKVIKKSRLGLYLDLTVGSLVILLNELAAFLYIRDNIKDQHMGYGIAALVVFMSTYIVFKLIARLVK